MSDERNWLASVGVVGGMAGFYLGVMAVLVLPGLLPFGSAERVATQILGMESWQAGVRLMEFENPVGLRQLAAAGELMRENATVIAACRQTVAKTGKDQPCTITVPVERK